jgi:hypothetical protein
MGYRDSNQTAGSSVAQIECITHPEICKKSVPAVAKGSCEYYKSRNQNYIERHDVHDGSCKPPDYYLNYGFKYCSRFKKETYLNLSPQGKAWLDKTLILLQDFMEMGVVEMNYVATENLAFNDRYKLPKNSKAFYTGIECRNADFKAFAFATHPDAYRPKDMQNLPAEDLVRIGLTPDFGEWGDAATWEQAGIMWDKMDVGHIVEDTVDRVIDGAKDKAQEAIEGIQDYAKETIETIREIF